MYLGQVKVDENKKNDGKLVKNLERKYIGDSDISM